jgi:hypothetical protein
MAEIGSLAQHSSLRHSMNAFLNDCLIVLSGWNALNWWVPWCSFAVGPRVKPEDDGEVGALGW